MNSRWQRRTITERFWAPVIAGAALSPLWLVLSRGSLAGVALVVLVLVHGNALVLARDPAFEEWAPATLPGRFAHRYVCGARWLRYGDGRNWVRAGFGLIGLLLTAFVVLGIGWAMKA